MSYFAPGPGSSPDGYGDPSGGIVGALINTGAGLYDSYKNRQQSKENVNKTLAAQKAEAELAYQRSVAQWNAQNLYNSPQAQMQRFIQAGLNPHLIYGQGNPGNASSIPQYQPANLQYKYEAANYGQSIQTLLPTLMAVGTWMQQMRLSEVQIDRGATETERARQMIDFLMQKNPKELETIDNRLSLFPYQRSMQETQMGRSFVALSDMQQDYRYKYGEDLFESLVGTVRNPPIGGLRRLQFIEEQSKAKLLDAKASWSEFDITDPQAIMMMVLQGVMGLAGQTLRLSTHRGASKAPSSIVPRKTGELPPSIRRLHPSRRQ